MSSRVCRLVACHIQSQDQKVMVNVIRIDQARPKVNFLFVQVKALNYLPSCIVRRDKFVDL